MKYFLNIILLINIFYSNDKGYKKLVKNSLSLYNKKYDYLFNIKFNKWKLMSKKLEIFMLKLKNIKLNNYEEFFNMLAKNKEIWKFFYNKKIKKYKSILEKIFEKKKHRDDDYYYIEKQLKFFRNKEKIKDNEFYFSPYWQNDESFDKFERTFMNIIYKNDFEKDINYIGNDYKNFINDFNFSISYKKLNINSKLELFYLNDEIFSYPIIFNYNFIPRIFTKKQINELNFYDYFFKKYKNKIYKKTIFNGENNLTLFDYKREYGVNSLLDNFLIFNSNFINTLNEYIIFHSDNLSENHLHVYNFNENNIFINDNKNGKAYYHSILSIFKITLPDKQNYKKIIKRENCDDYDSCYFSKLFEEENILDFDFIIKYSNIYFLFYEAKLFEFGNFFSHINLIAKVFSVENENFMTDDNDLNILINKIWFEFDLSNLKEIKKKIKYLLAPILSYFSDKINLNKDKKLITYFEDNYIKFNKKPSFAEFFIPKKLENLKNRDFAKNYDVVRKNHEFNYFILYDIVYKTFIYSFNKKKNSFYNSLIYKLKDKRSQLKLLGKEIIILFSYNSSLKKKIRIIKKNMEFVIQIVKGFNFVFNITKTIVHSSITQILRIMEEGFEDIKSFINKIRISKIMFENFNDYTNSLYKIINGVDIEKYIELKKQRDKVYKNHWRSNFKKSNLKISYGKSRFLKKINKKLKNRRNIKKINLFN